MSFKSIVSQKKFWRSVVLLGLGFLVVYDIISIFFEYGGFHISEFIADKTGEGKLVRFVFGQILSGLAYGFIISYGQFRSRAKQERN